MLIGVVISYAGLRLLIYVTIRSLARSQLALVEGLFCLHEATTLGICCCVHGTYTHMYVWWCKGHP